MRRGRLLRLAAAALAAAVGLVVAVPGAAFASSGSSDTTPATESSMISSAVVDGESLTIEFGQLMQGTFDPDDWTWSVDGVDQGHPHLVMWVGGLGRAKLTVSPAVEGGQQVTLSYTPGDGSLLRDGADNHLAAFTAHPVRNDSPDPPQPVVVVTLDVDDVTEETRELAGSGSQTPSEFEFFDPSDSSSTGYVQQPKHGQPAIQPDSERLLDNDDLDNSADGYGGKNQDHAQSFTTGKHRFGYALTAVSFDICFGRVSIPTDWNGYCTPRPADAPPDPTYKISLWTARHVPETAPATTPGSRPGHYVPDTQVATFDKANNEPLVKTPLVDREDEDQQKPDTSINSFTTSGGRVLLDPDTVYVVVFDFTSTEGASPLLTRSTTQNDGDYGFFIHSKVSTDIEVWRHWNAHLTRPSNFQGPGGWQIGAFGSQGTATQKYRIQLDGYEINPPTLNELGPDFSQVGSQHPGGCGGNPMPGLLLEDLKAGLHHYCHNPSGTWVKGRWPSPCDPDHPHYAATIARPGNQCGEEG